MKTTMKKLTALAMILLMALSMLTACGTKAYSAESYVHLYCMGGDGAGIASSRFNPNAFMLDVMADWKEEEQTKEHILALNKFCDSIVCLPLKTENLHNGDQITMTVTYDKEQAKVLGISLKNLESVHTVKNLK